MLTLMRSGHQKSNFNSLAPGRVVLSEVGNEIRDFAVRSIASVSVLGKIHRIVTLRGGL